MFQYHPQHIQDIAEKAFILRQFAADSGATLVNLIADIAQQAPFRQMETRRGFKMAASMTNCGDYGWLSDRQGYRYVAKDPLSNRPWPNMPELFKQLAHDAAEQAGFLNFVPDSCLINRYTPGHGMGLHQDKDERDISAPIVSVSLGVPAIFLFGSADRKTRPEAFLLQHGDVVVWGAEARLYFHGIKPIKINHHPLTGQLRFNLTLRRSQ